MASTPFNPAVFDQYTPTFAGADITALVILPDDEDRIRAAEEYLNRVDELLDVNLLDLETVDAFQIAENELAETNQNGIGYSLLPLINLQSVTVSTFRSKAQVRALGHVNAKGYARGSRTIAGTLILTEFDRDSFWQLIRRNVDNYDNNVGDAGSPVLVDQVAPFDLVLLFQNEYGRAAYRYIYGIELSTNGVVYSIMDMYNENTLSFTAHDCTPLLPIDSTSNIFLTGEKDGRMTPRIKNLASITSAKEAARRFRSLENSRNPFR